MYHGFHKFLRLSYELTTKKHGDWSDTSKPVIVLVHGIAASTKIWADVIKSLGDQPCIAVDLLGFGISHKPHWPDYSLLDHARSLHKTLSRQAPGRRFIISGHSLGSLVAIEYARLHYRSVDRLVLCSPPIYDLNKAKLNSLREATLRHFSHKLRKNSDNSLEVVMMDKYYQSLKRIIPFSQEELVAFLKTAKNSILFQTTYSDLMCLPEVVAVDILYGTLDAYMIPKNLSEIAEKRPNTTLKSLTIGHDIGKRYSKLIAQTISISQPVATADQT